MKIARIRSCHGVAATLALALLVVSGQPRVSSAQPPSGDERGTEPVSVSVRVEPDTVGVGEPFRYIVRVESTPDAEVVLPLRVGQIGKFLIRDYGENPPPTGSAVVSERWYELVPYSVGVQEVPGGEIAYRTAGGELQKLAVPDAVITVESLLDGVDDSATLELRDIRGPVGVPRGHALWWALGLGGLVAAAALLGLFLWLRRRDAAALAKPERPAHEWAFEALKRLRRRHLLEDGRQPEYYVRLSGIVREYIERRFHLRAAEMTTEEFLQAAQANRDLPVEHRARLGDFLGEADLVKFARHLPSVEQGEGAYEAAREFVAQTSTPAGEGEADHATA